MTAQALQCAVLGARAISAWLEHLPGSERALAFLRAQDTLIYLVGGTVRDALLGRPSADMDLAVDGHAMALARRLADHLGAAYVPLDHARDVARVVVLRGPERHYYDLAGLRAQGICADLQARDFTANAMAVALGPEGFGELLDPTGGERDLAARVLRATSSESFRQDPVRVLRLARLRGALGFGVSPETEALARVSVSALADVSAERLRDELMQILCLADAAEALAYADSLGLLTAALGRATGPGLQCALGVRAVRALEGALAGLDAAWSPYSSRLQREWARELSSGRERLTLLKLGALMSGASSAPPDADCLMQGLRLSAREGTYLARLFAALGSPIWAQPSGLDAVSLYRYYRDVDEAGVDAALLRLALGVGSGPPWAPPASESLPEHVGRLLRAWFELSEELVRPPRFLSGKDVMRALGLSPGPLVGDLLEQVREAQVSGLVRTREQALAYLRSRGESPPGQLRSSAGA